MKAALQARDSYATRLEEYLSTRRQPPADAAAKTPASKDDEKSKIEILKDVLARLPEQSIPELQLTKEADWYAAVEGELESTEDYRRALARLRAAGESRFASLAQPALKAYLSANNGVFPNPPSLLGAHFTDPASAAILQRYKTVPADEVKNVRVGGDWAITQINRIDSEFDSYSVIGPRGHGAFTKR
ncbi:MAG: hypothetical protein ABIQ12_08515 [Opitutaceae bacterium]